MARLKRPIHGGNIYAVARELGRDLTKLIDFSASINPLGPSPHIWPAITKARRLLTHYPDPDCCELRQTLARLWQRSPEHIAVGNGSMELIDALPRALKIQHLLVVHPTFSEYAASMARIGGRVSAVYAKRTERYVQPIEALCLLMEKQRHGMDAFDGVMLCNPNSPSGQACSVDEVQRLARIAQRQGIWLVIDEAFADYCPERSFLPQAASWGRVVILRSLTKFYALPGLRIGYAVAKPSVIELLRRHMSPWSVNAMGQVAALAAVRDSVHARKSLRFMANEQDRFGKLLTALPGCSVMPTFANYFLVELPRGRQACDVTARLRSKGILIRDCSSVPGCNARSVRCAVRSQRDNDQLIQSLSRLLHHPVS